MTDRRKSRNATPLKRYDDLLRASVDWVWETDRDLILLGVSESIAARLGYASATLKGKPIAALFADRRPLGAGASDSRGLEGVLGLRRAFRQHPASVLTRERIALSCVLSGVPYYEEGTGAFAGFRGTGLWSFEQEAWENERGDAHRRLLSLLDHALEQKDTLEQEVRRRDSLHNWSRLGAMAHELRTPLNAILGFSEIVRDWRLGDAEQRYREYGGIIHDSGLHLLEVVNDLLEITDKEKKALARAEPVDLIKVAQFVLMVMEEHAGQIGVALLNDLPEHLPLVRGERRALRQILLNLLSNALRYTPTGGEVRFAAETDDAGLIRLHVCDSGIGIAPEEQEKVFERFYRAKGSEAAADGKGLGLAISRQLARDTGGDILLKSRLGGGSRFTLVLPSAPCGDADAGPAPGDDEAEDTALASQSPLVPDPDDEDEPREDLLEQAPTPLFPEGRGPK